MTVRPARPPLPSDRALRELELLCRPDDAGCQPTRVQVEVCSSSEEAGCDVRDGLHDLLSALDAYDDYVAELRGDPIEPGPSPEDQPR